MPKKKRPQKGLEDNIKRTVYISYVDCALTEENLAAFFSDCGRIVDCRICGDPNSAMRFAFIEFQDVESAQKVRGAYLGCWGCMQLQLQPVGVHWAHVSDVPGECRRDRAGMGVWLRGASRCLAFGKALCDVLPGTGEGSRWGRDRALRDGLLGTWSRPRLACRQLNHWQAGRTGHDQLKT